MIAFEAKPSWLHARETRRDAARKMGRVSRCGISLALLGGVVATLVAAGTTPPAFAALRPAPQLQSDAQEPNS